ncbi:MAG: ABC transporter substrate-binding protein [Chloroflexi bacterium]|nr:ABC transporter substrate-binding protein [Chloroflexota bacterium]
MKNETLWSTIGMLTVVTLLLLSCGPRAAPAPASVPAPTSSPSSRPAAPVPVTPVPAAPAPTATAEKPKYGGTLNVIRPTDIGVFDTTTIPRGLDTPPGGGLVYEQFIAQDWAKGLAGSGEVDFGAGINRLEGYGSKLAESFEMPEIGTYLIKIRRGVHWALNPASEASRLVNGREFTADDAVWSVVRNTSSPTANILASQPGTAKAATIEKTGAWEVTLRTPVDPMAGWFWILYGGNSQHMWAPEVTQKFGNMQDWRNAVGTGPFMITDFVPGSVLTMIKNPNYWGNNPAGPGKGDHVPYVDMVKILIVPDLSTRLASMRTGKADWLSEIEWEDATGLIKTNPKLQSKKYLPSSLGVAMRLDKPDLPFKDKRVRQALMLATDFQALKNDLYGGNAEILVWPSGPNYPNLYVPMEKLPDDVQTLFKYNPERAKQLLADAGYPRGFKTKMIVQNTSTHLDPAATFKAMWAKIGVDVEIQPRESAVYTSITRTANAVEETIFTGGSLGTFPQYPTLNFVRGPHPSNVGRINDPPGTNPAIEAAFQEMQKNIIVNMPKVDQIYRELTPYLLEQAYFIPRPSPYTYTLWQPWVKNHYGATAAGFWIIYAWVDQDLKEQMTGRR